MMGVFIDLSTQLTSTRDGSASPFQVPSRGLGDPLSGLKLGTLTTYPGGGAPHSTLIGIAFRLASSVFGRVITRTPFLKVALILSPATGAGRATVREKAP